MFLEASTLQIELDAYHAYHQKETLWVNMGLLKNTGIGPLSS